MSHQLPNLNQRNLNKDSNQKLQQNHSHSLQLRRKNNQLEHLHHNHPLVQVQLANLRVAKMPRKLHQAVNQQISNLPKSQSNMIMSLLQQPQKKNSSETSANFSSYKKSHITGIAYHMTTMITATTTRTHTTTITISNEIRKVPLFKIRCESWQYLVVKFKCWVSSESRFHHSVKLSCKYQKLSMLLFIYHILQMLLQI